MIIKGINENCFLKIKKIGREGIIIEISEILGSNMSIIVDELEFGKLIQDLGVENDKN